MENETVTSLTYEQFMITYEEWHTSALRVLPPDQLTRLNSAAITFMKWNRSALIDKARIEEYLGQLAATKPSQVRAAMRVLRIMFIGTLNNPVLEIRAPKDTQRLEKESVTYEQYRHILKYYSRNYTDRDAMLYTMLLWHTGMASIDAHKLLWSSVDMQTGFISMKRSKTGVPAFIPIVKTGELYLMLKEQQDRNLPGLHVSEENNHGYMREQYHRFALACRNAGLPRGQSAHAFRRAFITRLSKAGVDVYTLKRYSGHASVTQLLEYLTPTKSDLIEKFHTAAGLPIQGGSNDPSVLPDPGPYTSRSSRYQPGHRRNVANWFKKGNVVGIKGQLGRGAGRGNEPLQSGVRIEPINGGESEAELHWKDEAVEEPDGLPQDPGPQISEEATDTPN